MKDGIDFSPACPDTDPLFTSEDELRRLQKMEAVGTFARVIAHDFNNLLASLMGYAELSMLEVPEETKAYEYMQQVVSITVNAQSMVEELRVLSLKSGQDLVPLQLNKVVSKVVEEAKSDMPESVRVTHSVSGNCSRVMADEGKIRKILLQLILNARQAMKESGGVLEIALDECELEAEDIGDPTVSPGRFVHIAVGDTGCGIERNLAGRIFDPYFTTKKDEKRAGVGLSYVQCFVRQHRGIIKVFSAPGQGSVFHVFFPVLKPEQGSHQEPPTAHEAAAC